MRRGTFYVACGVVLCAMAISASGYAALHALLGAFALVAGIDRILDALAEREVAKRGRRGGYVHRR